MNEDALYMHYSDIFSKVSLRSFQKDTYRNIHLDFILKHTINHSEYLAGLSEFPRNSFTNNIRYFNYFEERSVTDQIWCSNTLEDTVVNDN